MPFEDLTDDHPGLLAQLVQLRIALGEPEWAFGKLETLYASNRLSQVLEEPFMDLLLTRGEALRAFEAAEGFDLTVMPGWLLSNLAEAAVVYDMPEYGDRMIERLGEGFLESRPILGTELAMARDDTEGAAAWAEKAEAFDLDLDQQVALSGLYARMDRRDDAIRILSRLAIAGDLPDSAVGDLTLFYLESSRESEGLQIIEALRRGRDSVEIETGWALLATAEEQSAEVVSWFDTTRSVGLSVQALSDIFFMAGDTAQKGVALAAADRLYRKRPTPGNRLLLASAQVTSDRPVDALPHLRALLPGNLEVQDTYVRALSAARVGGEPVDDELRRFLSIGLSEPQLYDARTEQLVYGLLDLEAYDTVLPAVESLARRRGGSWFSAYLDTAVKADRVEVLVDFLEEELTAARHPDLAEDQLYALIEHGGDNAALPYLRAFSDERGGNWNFAYEEALRNLNRSEELLAVWSKRAAESSTSGAEKRDLAFRMLDARHKAAAEAVFRRLARGAPPDDENVSQLLFLWGPRPRQEELTWLEERARSSRGRELAGWMRHLINSGVPSRAATIAEARMSEARSERDVFEAYLDALIASGSADALGVAIERELPFIDEPDRLKVLGQRAIEVDHTPTRRIVYTKLLQLRPDEPEALRQLGLLEFVGGNFAQAEGHLSRHVRSTGGDAETSFYYGELLLRRNLTAEADVHYRHALSEIESVTPPFQIRVVKALLLHRLDRLAESLAQFEDLLGERPDDKHLRADYAGVLLEAGLYEDAERILQR